MQCQHPGCSCQARDGDRWCSDHCKQAGTAHGQQRCGCGHPGCGG